MEVLINEESNVIIYCLFTKCRGEMSTTVKSPIHVEQPNKIDFPVRCLFHMFSCVSGANRVDRVRHERENSHWHAILLLAKMCSILAPGEIDKNQLKHIGEYTYSMGNT